MSSKIRVAINGFGRIGKTAFRIAWQFHRDEIEIVAINDLNTTQMAAHVLKYDSVYHHFPFDVSATEDALIVDGVSIPKYSFFEPEKLPWKNCNVDVVLECTGAFTKKKDAEKHIIAGARTVIISAPGKGDDPVPTYVLGVNNEDMKNDTNNVFSNASCTTNCIAPVMKVLEDCFGIEKAMMTTIHAYTADQNLVDGMHKDLRRARSAALNIVPTTTGAAIATTETISSLQNKFDGLAFRVPVPVGSVSDITALVRANVTKEQINETLREAASSDRFRGILEVTNDPIVSTDIIGNPASSIVDAQLTNVVGGNLVKVVAWYDNEYGYSHRLIEETIVFGRRS